MTIQKLNRLHFKYWILFLLAVVIILLAALLGAIPDWVKYAICALSLTSLVLALIAIIYAFISNSSFHQSIAAIQSAAKDASDAARSAKHTIEEIPKQIKSVDEKVGELPTLMERLFSEPAAKDEVDTTEEGKALITSDKDVIRFFSGASLSGVVSLYACCVAYEKKCPFKSNELWSRVSYVKEKYADGFLVASRAAGILDYDVDNKELNIISINNFVRENIKQIAEEGLKGFTRKYDRDFEKEKDKSLGAIEKYFSEL